MKSRQFGHCAAALPGVTMDSVALPVTMRVGNDELEKIVLGDARTYRRIAFAIACVLALWRTTQSMA